MSALKDRCRPLLADKSLSLLFLVRHSCWCQKSPPTKSRNQHDCVSININKILFGLLCVDQRCVRVRVCSWRILLIGQHGCQNLWCWWFDSCCLLIQSVWSQNSYPLSSAFTAFDRACCTQWREGMVGQGPEEMVGFWVWIRLDFGKTWLVGLIFLPGVTDETFCITFVHLR